MISSPLVDTATVVLTGNPNCGKTTLFNALTGLRAKVANYPGVTVERKEGRMLEAPSGLSLTILDLPGTYSLSPQSLDEQVVQDVLFHRITEVPSPSVVVIVMDATNLERSLYYGTQVIELGLPTVVALNMMDVAEANGQKVDTTRLAQALGVPVVPVVATAGRRINDLKHEIIQQVLNPTSPRFTSFCELPELLRSEQKQLIEILGGTVPPDHPMMHAQALLLLSDASLLRGETNRLLPEVRARVQRASQKLSYAGYPDSSQLVIEARYRRVSSIQQAVVTDANCHRDSVSDRVDRVLIHPKWGLFIFGLVMLLIFQSIFGLAQFPMQALDSGISWIGQQLGRTMPPGDLHDLLLDGVIAGVGAVVVFLPQIGLLFLFIAVLEDSGYMARAAFLMDRLMSKVGLHGKSFIPLLSCYACAIPGIMATRTIESPKDRLATILIAPLMTCSARLPIYTLLIAACIPNRTLFGVFSLPGMTLLFLYLLGVISALMAAWLLKKTVLKSEPPLLILELPPYRRPSIKAVLRQVWERAVAFLQKAGTVILAFNIILWFLATYPKSKAIDEHYTSLRQELAAAPLQPPPGMSVTEFRQHKIDELSNQEASAKLQHSLVARLGQCIEPALKPLGMDWKIGIGIICSFAAREVFIGSMSTVYSVGNSKESSGSLAQVLQVQKRENGKPMYTPLMGLTLLIFYVYALQCASTVAIVRRETNSWKWPVCQWLTLTFVAWLSAFLVYQGGRLLGLE
jgi:ferrous iron transport protein B